MLVLVRYLDLNLISIIQKLIEWCRLSLQGTYVVKHANDGATIETSLDNQFHTRVRLELQSILHCFYPCSNQIREPYIESSFEVALIAIRRFLNIFYSTWLRKTNQKAITAVQGACWQEGSELHNIWIQWFGNRRHPHVVLARCHLGPCMSICCLHLICPSIQLIQFLYILAHCLCGD